MKTIQPSFELSTPFGPLTPEVGIQLLRFIESQARISHRSEDLQTHDSWRKFIQNVVMDHGDFSVIEHASVTAVIRTDRQTSHQLVRTRLASYTQESQRFTRYGKRTDLEFIEPLFGKPSPLRFTWERAMADAEAAYFEMLDYGAKPQEARTVLPNSTATTVAMTCNLRSWRAFLLSRVSRETQEDFRRITIPMLEEFKRVVPILFDDIEPNARQIDNLRKAR
jgi:thymidylate synthase (FAD)